MRSRLRFVIWLSLVLSLNWALGGPLDQGAQPYGRAFRSIGNSVLEPIGGEFVTRLRNATPEPGRQVSRSGIALEIVLRRREGAPLGRKKINSKRLGYRPTVLFLSLVLCSFYSWRRKWRALIVGGLWLHAYLGVRVLARVLLAWTEVSARPGVDLVSWLESEDTASALTLWLRIENEAFLHLIVPIALWGLACVPAKQWRGWIGLEHESAEDSAPRA